MGTNAPSVGTSLLGSDSEDEDFVYEELQMDSDVESSGGSDEDELAAIVADLKLQKSKESQKSLGEFESCGEEPCTQVRPSVIDDFFRNFLIKLGMRRTLDAFNTEWYELQAKGCLHEEDIGVVPDVYLRNQALSEQVKALRSQLETASEVTHKAKSTWDKFRKERDHHRMHHNRVVQEKQKLQTDLKRLQKLFASYEPTLQELRNKYETAMKEKMLVRLDRDKLAARLEILERNADAATRECASASKSKRADKGKKQTTSSASGGATSHADGAAAEHKRKKDGRTAAEEPMVAETRMPTAPVPVEPPSCSPVEPNRLSSKSSFKAHDSSISGLAWHPSREVLATTSDDQTWKVWSLSSQSVVLSGRGHSSWIAGLSFHPRGSSLLTSSGDSLVKLWDFASAKCTLTLSEHTHAVWEVDFHEEGDFAASCSMDHTIKLWDLHVGHSRHTFRGHVDSVNSVAFQRGSLTLCSGSADKTVSLWDMRSGLCSHTFYGHSNTVCHVKPSPDGAIIASCDADGHLKIWDARMVSEVASITSGKASLNKISFDASGQVLAVGSDDSTVKLVSLASLSVVRSLSGHEDPVQALAFAPHSSTLASSGDGTVRIWGY